MTIGSEMLSLAKQLFPICRSITGPGVRETLGIIQSHIPDLAIHSVPTGTQCLDWVVPKEWTIRGAYVLGPEGEKIVDFEDNNLHIVSYSDPVDKTIPLEELQKHLFSRPDLPDAIPYITSYYDEFWGFCLPENQRKQLKPGNYRVKVDSDLRDGVLNYGEIVLKGESEQEILLSTYICHPSMANDQLSGPCVTTFILKWLMGLERRRFTYRAVFIPETIGSAVFISKNLEHLREHVLAGFNVACIGDDRDYSYLPSRQENTLADRIVQHVLKHEAPSYSTHSFLDRGSDERQYCSPGVDLPVASIMRTKYACYPEYHTSLDNFDVVTSEGLAGGYNVLQKCLECLEINERLQVTVAGEPNQGKWGLAPTFILERIKDKTASYLRVMDILVYSDGKMDLLGIMDKIGVPLWAVKEDIRIMKEKELLVPVSKK